MLEIFGGPDRDRTDDLFHAMEARSQTAPQAHVLDGMQPIHFRRSGMIRQTETEEPMPAIGGSNTAIPATIRFAPSRNRVSLSINITAPAA
jgi:hypothetical protein